MMSELKRGKLYGLGVGPGDPELITLKAHRILKSVGVIAYPAPDSGISFARKIVASYLDGDQKEIPIIVPMRVERFPAAEVYDRASLEISAELDAGKNVALLCEGDPFFYGSFMYVFERLAAKYSCEIVPGVSSMMAGAAAISRPLAARNDVLSVVPAPLCVDDLRMHLGRSDAIAIIKIGRHFKKVRSLIDEMGLMECAGYVERVTLSEERLLPLKDVGEDSAPYFSMILIYRGSEGWISNLPVGKNN